MAHPDRRICVVTGSRAEYGLLRPLMEVLRSEPGLVLQTVATGMHLAAEFGHTIDAILADGFVVEEKVEMLVSSDTGTGAAKSVGLGLIGFADALARLAPDLVVVLGDRFELLSAVQAALFLRIPVAHLCGGDTTEGAFDESVRHALTKMSHLHFVTNALSARRVVQMGEDPAAVHVVGATGLDLLTRMDKMSRAELEDSLGFTLRRRNLVVTFHPITLDQDSGIGQMQALLDALAQLAGDVGIVITLPNADPGGRRFTEMLKDFAAGRDNVSVHTSLGQKRYYSLLALADAMVGNSSSGISEAPSFGIATVNIGDRQGGRFHGESVIDCPAETGAILAAIERALDSDFTGTVNPYGDGQACGRILAVLRGIEDLGALVKKKFHLLEPS